MIVLLSSLAIIFLLDGNAFLLESSRAGADIMSQADPTKFKYPSYIQEFVGSETNQIRTELRTKTRDRTICFPQTNYNLTLCCYCCILCCLHIFVLSVMCLVSGLARSVGFVRVALRLIFARLIKLLRPYSSNVRLTRQRRWHNSWKIILFGFVRPMRIRWSSARRHESYMPTRRRESILHWPSIRRSRREEFRRLLC